MQTTTIRIEKELFERIRKHLFERSLTGERISLNKYFVEAIREKASTIGG